MRFLEKINDKVFPLSWVNTDYFPDSKGEKKEIYLTDDKDILDGLILLFYSLFSSIKNDIKIYNSSWWDYCLDTWNADNDEYDYTLERKSQESQEYLLLLSESSIEVGYSGSCICLNWDGFLYITLQCLINNKAPYSPIFYDIKNNFFFYFHQTGSLGFYYETENETVCKILSIAEKNYDVR